MSNDNINASAEEVYVDPIDEDVDLEDGQVEEAEDAGAEAEQEELDFFDYTEVSDKYVKLQVDGEEVSVPIKEALAGYQRQADYTRKTQELSDQRKQMTYAAALQEALQSDPAGTLKLLQEHYGVNDNPEQDEFLDPSEVQLRQLEKRIAAFEQEKETADLLKTIDSLKVRYGDDFDADEIVAKALAEGSTDLEAVFKKAAFDKVYTKVQKKNTEDSRTQAKRQQSVVSGGSSSRTSVSTPGPIRTVQEAFALAQKNLGE
jgi:hypothetical protein